MKKLFLAGAAFAALIAGRAMAADLAAPVYAVPVAPIAWSGLYVGLNAGGTWSSANDVTITTLPVRTFGGIPTILISDAGPAAASASGIPGLGRKAGFIGGGQAGYNWQLGSFVAGVESDIQGVVGRGGGSLNRATGVALVGPGAAPSGVPSAAGTPDITTFNASKNLDYLGTVRARFGYLASPALLAYATGGLAYGYVSGSAGFTTCNPAYPGAGLSPTWGASNFFSSTRAGWALGGGLEWMFAPSFTVKAEYLYYDLGSVSTELGTSGSVVLPGSVGAGSPWFTNASTVSTRYSGNILRVGLNYQLGGLPGFPRF
jgi:outer membrane immunogenic protein